MKCMFDFDVIECLVYVILCYIWIFVLLILWWIMTVYYKALIGDV